VKRIFYIIIFSIVFVIYLFYFSTSLTGIIQISIVWVSFLLSFYEFYDKNQKLKTALLFLFILVFGIEVFTKKISIESISLIWPFFSKNKELLLSLTNKLKYKKFLFLTILYLTLFNLESKENPIDTALKNMELKEYYKSYEILNEYIKNNNSPEAFNILGWLYFNGKGVEKDEKKGCEYFKKAADDGFVKAYYNVGMCYEYGKGFEYNINEAIKYYEKGYENSDSKSSYALGMIYFKGCKIEGKKDIKKAIKYLHYSCKKSLANGCYKLGDLYMSEIKDYDKGIKYYEKAAKKGYCKVYSTIGDYYLYSKEDRKEKDIKKAVKYYKKGVECNDEISMYKLSFIYFTGIKPFEKDDLKAFDLASKSASLGYKPAYGILGVIYATSDKIEKNIDKASEYLNIAINANDTYSIFMKKELCERKILNCLNQ
jgi:TPR repeat protein